MALDERELTIEIDVVRVEVKGRLRRELSSFAVLLLTLSSLSPVVSVFGVGGDACTRRGRRRRGCSASAS